MNNQITLGENNIQGTIIYDDICEYTIRAQIYGAEITCIFTKLKHLIPQRVSFKIKISDILVFHRDGVYDLNKYSEDIFKNAFIRMAGDVADEICEYYEIISSASLGKLTEYLNNQ